MTAYTERAKGSHLADVLAENAQLLSIAAFFVACLVFFALGTDTFLTAGNILNVLRQAAPVLIVAAAMTLVIVTGGIDLSVGSQVALVNAVAAIVMSHGVPSLAAVVLMLLLGAVMGLAQGWFIAHQKMEPFIVTLAGLSILRGLALWLTQGYSIPIQNAPGFFWLGRGGLLGVPVPALIAVIIAIAGFVTLRSTRYGRRVVAVGSNLEAARRVGMPSQAIVASVYVVSGLACGVAGLLIAARLGSGSSNAAVGFELQVIAAVVLGGTALSGGRGSMLGTVLGTLTIAVIGNGLILMHISPFFTPIVTGAIILVAIWLNTRIFNARFRLGESQMTLAQTHVRSGQVMTVLGPIPSAAIGETLMHEHILNDCRCWWNPPQEPERQYLAKSPVRIEILSELRQNPFVNLHNIALDDEALAVEELKAFAAVGGGTVVDPTCRGIGRNPEALARISRATGLNIVMGAGYYLQSSHPPEVARLSADAIAEEIVAEALDGVGGTSVRIGLIGEIGVSSDFTADERKSLAGAARAQQQTGLPLMVHLPGWFRLGHEVLDLVEANGGELAHTVLCHINPAHADFDYQATLARRGAYLEFDMIGMDFFYADQQVQCPSDDEVARAIVKLVDAGLTDRVLLSHDVFLKMMLTRYGGNGYAFVSRYFLPRLRRHGLDAAAVADLMTANPRRVFDATATD